MIDVINSMLVIDVIMCRIIDFVVLEILLYCSFVFIIFVIMLMIFRINEVFIILVFCLISCFLLYKWKLRFDFLFECFELDFIFGDFDIRFLVLMY